MTTKETILKSLKHEAANVGDNLYHYKHFANPTDRTGNGESIGDIVVSLQTKYDELQAAIREVETG